MKLKMGCIAFACLCFCNWNEAAEASGLTIAEGQKLREGLPADVFQLSPDQIKWLDWRYIKRLTREQRLFLLNNYQNYLSDSQLIWIFSMGTSWLTEEDSRNLPSSLLARLYLRAMPDVFFQSITGEQVRHLPSSRIAELEPRQIVLLGDRIAYFTQAQIKALTRAQVGALTDEQIGALKPLHIGVMSGAQLSEFKKGKINLFERSQIAAIAPEALEKLAIPAFAYLGKNEIEAMSKEQIIACVHKFDHSMLECLSSSQFQQAVPDNVVIEDWNYDQVSPKIILLMSPRQVQLLKLSNVLSSHEYGAKNLYALNERRNDLTDPQREQLDKLLPECRKAGFTEQWYLEHKDEDL